VRLSSAVTPSLQPPETVECAVVDLVQSHQILVSQQVGDLVKSQQIEVNQTRQAEAKGGAHWRADRIPRQCLGADNIPPTTANIPNPAHIGQPSDLASLAFFEVAMDYKAICEQHPELQTEEINGLEEAALYGMAAFMESSPVQVFDSGCSASNSGCAGRLTDIQLVNQEVQGVGGSLPIQHKGMNPDAREEYFTKGMPKGIVLLSAHDYISDGVAVLHADGGTVYNSVNATQRKLLDEAMAGSTVSLHLAVQRGVYVRAHNQNPLSHHPNAYYGLAYDPDESLTRSTAVAFQSNVSTKFFNTHVQVNNGAERILTLMLSGFTTGDLLKMIKHNSVTGIHPSVDTKMINSFVRTYGTRPDLIKLAYPQLKKNQQGLRQEPTVIDKVGQRVELDKFENDTNVQTTTQTKSGKIVKTSKKQPSWGGAIAYALLVDNASGYPHCKLLKNMGENLELVQWALQEYRLNHTPIGILASDQGIVSQTIFQVSDTQVATYLRNEGVIHEQAEPRNHARGTPTVEGMGAMVKGLVRMAYIYLFRNPNLESFGFTKLDLLKLWSEVVTWAVCVIRMKSCPADETKSREEFFLGTKPNIQNRLMLPIFSLLLVYREAGGIVNDSLPDTNKSKYQVGLYVGPSGVCDSTARIAVKINDQVMILVTSRFTSASQGGGLNIYPLVELGLSKALAERTLPTVATTDQYEEPVQQQPNDNSVPNTVTDMLHSLNLEHLDVKQAQPEQGVINSIPPEQAEPEQGVINSIPPDQGVVISTTQKRVGFSDPVVSTTNGICSESTNLTKGKSKLPKQSKTKKDPITKPPKPVVPPDPPVLPRPTGTNAREWREQTPEKKLHPKPFRKGNPHNGRSKKHDKESAPARYVKEFEQMYTRGAQRRGNKMAHIAMWVDVHSERYYMSMQTGDYFLVPNHCDIPEADQVETYPHELDPSHEFGFVQVRTGVPRSYPEALRDPDWGEAAQAEWQKLAETRCLVLANPELAREAIRNGATLVNLFPIYEKKIKENREVNAVRLVADGRCQKGFANTFAPTPAKEELLVLLHLAATYDWDIVHLDEVRAYLQADYTGEKPAFARVKGDPNHYSVLKSLYGLPLSGRAHSDLVSKRIKALGYTQLGMCRCIYTKYIEDELVIFFHHSDDFIMTGSHRAIIEVEVLALREVVNTTPPAWDPTRVLGYTLTRDRVKRIYKLDIASKIVAAHARLNISPQHQGREPHVPMPQAAYILTEEEFDNLPPDQSVLLDKRGIHRYQELVGFMIWTSGIRYDIVFALQYLSWFTQSPRQHHLKYAEYAMNYLLASKDIPLVLGGDSEMLRLTSFSDATVGTAPKGKSNLAQIHKLSRDAGAILAKAYTSNSIHLASFTSELDAVSGAVKGSARLSNVLKEILGKIATIPVLYSDNKAVLEFLKGNSNPSQSRYMELRLFYIREKWDLHKISLEYMPGVVIPADKLTKLAVRSEFEAYRHDVQGHALL
jgi:hypothetical protein